LIYQLHGFHDKIAQEKEKEKETGSVEVHTENYVQKHVSR
jgi:hypothetical protein